MKKLTKHQIAHSFGERIGECVEIKDIRVRGNWLFHRTKYDFWSNSVVVKYDNRVDCYWAKDANFNSGVLCMEAWDAVEYENSPFIVKNDEKVSIELKRLDKSYKKHLYDQTEEGKLEKRQNNAIDEYLNKIIENDKELQNKCIEIRDKKQEELDKKYGKNKKYVLGISIEDLRKANLITKEMDLKIQQIKKETK